MNTSALAKFVSLRGTSAEGQERPRIAHRVLVLGQTRGHLGRSQKPFWRNWYNTLIEIHPLYPIAKSQNRLPPTCFHQLAYSSSLYPSYSLHLQSLSTTLLLESQISHQHVERSTSPQLTGVSHLTFRRRNALANVSAPWIRFRNKCHRHAAVSALLAIVSLGRFSQVLAQATYVPTLQVTALRPARA